MRLAPCPCLSLLLPMWDFLLGLSLLASKRDGHAWIAIIHLLVTTRHLFCSTAKLSRGQIAPWSLTPQIGPYPLHTQTLCWLLCETQMRLVGGPSLDTRLFCNSGQWSLDPTLHHSTASIWQDTPLSKEGDPERKQGTCCCRCRTEGLWSSISANMMNLQDGLWASHSIILSMAAKGKTSGLTFLLPVVLPNVKTEPGALVMCHIQGWLALLL